MKKILVTGGCGYIGSHTIVDLIENGFDVISIDDNSRSTHYAVDGIEKITGKRIKNYKVDLKNFDETQAVFQENVDIVGVIHFAAYKAVGESVQLPLMYFENNLFSLINLLKCVKEFNVPHFVFSSSCTVYGNPDSIPVTELFPIKKAESPYGATKQMGEEIIQDFSRTEITSSILLRYFNPVGAHPSGLIGELPLGKPMNLVPAITQTAIGKIPKMFVWGTDYPTRDGSCVRDYIHVCDIAHAHTLALEYLISEKNKTKCDVFNLGTGDGVTVLEAIHMFEEVSGVKLNYDLGPRRNGDVVAIYANNDLVVQSLGWKIKYGLKEMIDTAWKWELFLVKNFKKSQNNYYMKEVVDSFGSNFKTTPRLFFSPGRINLIGEHIDYNHGYVMPAAIDKGLWFAVAANDTNFVNFFSVDMNESYSVSLDAVRKQEGWKNYVLGVLNVLEENNIKVGGFDCAFGGNLPVGAGLSSSAAVEGGLIYALATIFNLKLDRVSLAKMAQKAEHSYPGVKCGIMDQFANLNGKKGQVILLDCVTLGFQYLQLQLNEYAIYLIDTKVHHSLASGEYNKRRNDCEEGFAILQQKIGGDIISWRQITSDQILLNKTYLGDRVFDRCLFVTQEIGRTQKAAELLKQNNLAEFGKLMFQTHEGLSKLYEVSCLELDFLVDQAKLFPEVIGARVMGGGFGGCTINIIEKAKADAIISKISSAYEKKFNITPEVYEVGISDGTLEII